MRPQVLLDEDHRGDPPDGPGCAGRRNPRGDRGRPRRQGRGVPRRRPADLRRRRRALAALRERRRTSSRRRFLTRAAELGDLTRLGWSHAATSPLAPTAIPPRARRLVISSADAVVTIQLRRTRKIEKLARIYDDEIAPCWGARFGRLLLRDLVVPEVSQVLDVACRTGIPTLEILRLMGAGSRLIAIDESSAMLDVARRKVAALGPLGGKAVFFRTESAVPRLSFADDVYDLVVCNLGTLPLAGTFEEFHDLYREVLIKHDRHDALDRLDLHLASYPTFDHVEHCLAAAGLAGRIEIDEFSLLFRSSREFFFAPVIEYGPLGDWKSIAGSGQDMQDVFWYIKEAIDAYFAGRPFHVTVKAGLVIGTKPAHAAIDRSHDPGGGDGFAADVITTPVPLTIDTEDSPFDDIETGLPWPPPGIADGSVVDDRDDPAIAELASGDYALDEDSLAEQELDAFIEGKKRPQHLID
ncbi:MAG: methyltransferase domain-containing protein [Deltaproteobacteria bacterium]|nr:MAG: methyltransferase domain-containing protein [Deltaproteobacteria bacterium]